MSKLPPPEDRNQFHNALFDKGAKAKLSKDDDIVYTENDVIELMNMMKDAALDWAAENAMVSRDHKPENGHFVETNHRVNKFSILVGKTEPKLTI